MATPHDDTAPPSATDYPSEEELAEVDRLDREATESPVTLGPNAERRLSELGLTLLPRVVRALRAAASELSEARGAIEARDDLLKIYAEDVKKERDAYARGRREAVAHTAEYLRRAGHPSLATLVEENDNEPAPDLAALTESERARGGE